MNKQHQYDLVEHFTIRANQGAVNMLLGLHKPGYRIVKILRANTKATVYFKEVKDVAE